MRNAFVAALVELAARDERVVLLTADLGYTVVEPFSAAFPERFFNCGVAEQNAVGLATGLAEAGHVPFVYSIATFATLRPYEFIRNGPLLHQLPVRIAGIGGGLDYGHNGITHYALEDLAVMRAQPEMTVIAPADAGQTRAAVLATGELDGPVYLRVGREGPPVAGLDEGFELGRVYRAVEGGDLTLVATGGIAPSALAAAELLAADGVSAGVLIVPTLAPAPTDELAALLADVPVVVTVEEHYVVGGLGSLTAEVIAERSLGSRLVRCGIREMVRGTTGSPEYMRARFGLDPAGIAAAARGAVAAVV